MEQIAQNVQAQFGEKADPLYDRLAQYLNILRSNRFIYYRGVDREPKAADEKI